MTVLQIADVNWLLSALAQASAALIAIVGGLLVSRYVALHAEQEAARRRVEDLSRREVEAKAELASAERALDTYYVDEALDDEDVYEEILRAELEPTVEGVLEALDRDGQDLNMEVFGERLTLMVADMREAIEVIHPEVPDSETHDDWSDFRKAHDLKPLNRDLWEWLYERICEEKREAAKRRSREAMKRSGIAGGYVGSLIGSPDYGSLLGRITSPEITAANRMIRSQREIAAVNGLEAELAEARASLRALGQERRLAEETYEATRQPEGFVLALRVMSVLAVLGMGVPVAVMAFGPMTLPGWARAVVVAVFFGGVALLLRFLFVYASFLREGGRDKMPPTVLGLLRPSRQSRLAKGRTSADQRAASRDE